MKTYEKIDKYSVRITETKPVEQTVDLIGVKRKIENLERQKSDTEISIREAQGRVDNIQAEIDTLTSLVAEVKTAVPSVKDVVEEVKEEVVAEEVTK